MISAERRVYLIVATGGGALLAIIVSAAAQAAHAGLRVPFASWLLLASATTWRLVGATAAVVALVLIAVLVSRRRVRFRMPELTSRILKPQLHVQCRGCGLARRIIDAGARPIAYECLRCGLRDDYGGPENGDKDFVSTRLEVKTRCGRCKTRFRIADPLVRPLFVECPTCRITGALQTDQRPRDAEAVPVRCLRCGHGYHAFAVRGRWNDPLPCPNCGIVNTPSRNPAAVAAA